MLFTIFSVSADLCLCYNILGECQEVLSEPQGTDGMGKRYTFIINSPDEYITAVDVRAGGWVDAIRLHTNYKSSIWMGGTGGDEYHLIPPPGRKILGLIGTSGQLVGSLGVLFSRLIHFNHSLLKYCSCAEIIFVVGYQLQISSVSQPDLGHRVIL